MTSINEERSWNLQGNVGLCVDISEEGFKSQGMIPCSSTVATAP